MLRPRVIPCLLLKDKGLVKSEKFKDYRYVGDPLNAVRIFNEKKADELMLLDIDCSVQKREPNYDLIEKVASECRMPLCYGGGIKTVEQALRILSLGVEKISISSAAVESPEFIRELASQVGNQSVVVTIDYKKPLLGSRTTYIYNGTQKTKISALDLAKKVSEMGAGEVVLNSIDLDGTLDGYDLGFLSEVKSQIQVPLTIMGGASSLENLKEAHQKLGIIGMGVGRLFVLKGKHKAVLINYSNKI